MVALISILDMVTWSAPIDVVGGVNNGVSSKELPQLTAEELRKKKNNERMALSRARKNGWDKQKTTSKKRKQNERYKNGVSADKRESNLEVRRKSMRKSRAQMTDEDREISRAARHVPEAIKERRRTETQRSAREKNVNNGQSTNMEIDSGDGGKGVVAMDIDDGIPQLISRQGDSDEMGEAGTQCGGKCGNDCGNATARSFRTTGFEGYYCQTVTVPTLVEVNPVVVPTYTVGDEGNNSNSNTGGEEHGTNSQENDDQSMDECDQGNDIVNMEQDNGSSVEDTNGNGYDGPRFCFNCMRQEIPNDTSCYKVELSPVQSTDIRKLKTRLRHVRYNNSVILSNTYQLCKECESFLVYNFRAWKLTWPSFVWNILSGVDSRTGRRFHDVYSAQDLWKFVPKSLRKYWVHAITQTTQRAGLHGQLVDMHGSPADVMRSFCEHNAINYRKYERLDVDSTCYFVDRTEEVEQFLDDIESRDMKRLLGVLNPAEGQKPIILPDVLCPWGCTEFCFESEHCNYGLLVQHHLRKVQLNFPESKWYQKLYLVETSRTDFLREKDKDSDDDEVPYDRILLNDNWRIRPTVQFVTGKGLMIMVCRHHKDSNTTKRLYPHPPRKPHHNLSSERTDQLAHAQLVQRQFSPLRQRKKCTTYTQQTQLHSYSGSDSMNVTTEPRFKKGSVMLFDSEILSMAGRRDINHLASRNVLEGLMPEELANTIRGEAEVLYPEPFLDKYRNGATYVGMCDSMWLHFHPRNSTVRAFVKRRDYVNGGMEEVTIALQRSWLPIINYLQTEDSEGYGTVPKAIIPYRGKQKSASMIQWAVSSAIVGCKELHVAIDQKVCPFRHDNWAGHVLAHLHYSCMKFQESTKPKGSPFIPKRASAYIRDMMEKCLPEQLRDYEGTATDRKCFYKFNLEYWQNLFPLNDYTTISLGDSVANVTVNDRTNVIIVVGESCPVADACAEANIGNIIKDGAEFESRVIMSFKASSAEDQLSRTKFEAVRYVRNGGGFNKWWQQHRASNSHALMTKHCGNTSFPTVEDGCFMYVSVYVRMRNERSEQYKLDFMKSLGGQVHVFCSCTIQPFPLIISHGSKTEKRNCTKDNCGKTAHYICSSPTCKTGLCNQCFDSFPILEKSFMTPNNEAVDNDVMGERETNNNNNRDADSEDGGLEQGYHFQWEEGMIHSGEEDSGDDNSLMNSLERELSLDDESVERSNIPHRGNVNRSDDIDNETRSHQDEGSDIDNDDFSRGDNDAGTVATPIGNADSRSLADYSEARSLADYSEAPPEDEEDDSVDNNNNIMNLQQYPEDSIRNRAMRLRESAQQYRDNDPESPDYIRRGDEDLDGFVLDDFLTDSNYNPIDGTGDNEDDLRDSMPATNAGGFAHTVLSRNKTKTVPVHVLFNQAGSVCTRYNKRIKGSQVQQNFIQRIISTIQGFSVPLLYLMGMCFPRHFYLSAKHDPSAILGAAPISCYTSDAHPHGFASSLSIARNLGTHSSSSTSTCSTFWSFLYDIQANKAAGGIDSRLINRHGFVVDVKSKHGLSIRGGTDEGTKLKESVDSHQAALDLAATQPWIDFDIFFTFTANHAEHPGIKHLYEWKESMEWTKTFSRDLNGNRTTPFVYNELTEKEKVEVKRSFEMANGSVIGRCWMEVRKLWLEYITYSTTSILKGTTHVFFRDEYQEKSGNLPHIHGLVALTKRDLENKEFLEFICELQKCAVCDLFSTDSEDMEKYIEDGLFESPEDWTTLTASASEKLTHTCDERCLRRVGDGDGAENFQCRKIHSVFGKSNPLEHEFIPMYFDFSDACRNILERSGLWEPPTEPPHPDYPHGKFHSDLLLPKRHMGRVHPEARCNMSPVFPEFFAATKSMQNAQILTGTNGVAKYVVKYVVKLDQGNRCNVWADAHTGAIMRVDHQFLHNTKIASSKHNEDKAHEKSKSWNKPTGRAIAFPEMQQQLLGYPEVMTNIKFVRICTKPFEHRATTTVKLDKEGNLVRPRNETNNGGSGDIEGLAPDEHEGRSITQKQRMEMVEKHGMTSERMMTMNQNIIYGQNRTSSGRYDEVTLFGLRPVELLELVPLLGLYYRWFEVGKVPLSPGQIEDAMSVNISQCAWIDALGRQVRVRHGALGELRVRLGEISEDNVKQHSWELRNYLIHMIDSEDLVERFVYDDNGDDLPIPVFSSVTPKNPVPFLLHMMLSLGEYETELDIRQQGTMRESLAKAKLIGTDFDNEESLERYSNELVRLVVNEVFAVQPVSLRRLDEYIVMAKQIFDGVLFRDEIPVTDLPPCILTDMLNCKEEELDAFWEEKRRDQLAAIYKNLPDDADIPSQEEVFVAWKGNPLDWDPVESFHHFEGQGQNTGQSIESYNEQKLAIKIGSRSIRKYTHQFGPETKTFTKGCIIHGAPGSGKSHVNGWLALYAMTQGLRVMTTALMGVRANALGGVHFHRLIAMMAKKRGNPYRLAELALDKLRRKSQIKFLHAILTMDVLVIDECGQLSAQQLTILDIILRTARRTSIPFGGVLIIGTMDHRQLGAIDGCPFLMSSHVLTDFVLIELKHSVRAHGDGPFQRIQQLCRMSPGLLLSDEPQDEGGETYEAEFKRLLEENFTFVDSWDSAAITPDVQRMYARRMPAYEASEQYVNSCQDRFEADGIDYSLSKSEDLQRLADSRAEFGPVENENVIKSLNHGVKEPKKLLFWHGAQFEATINGDGYNQSQLLLMLSVPSEEHIMMKTPIELMAAPPGVTHVDVSNGVPTEEELLDLGWNPVRVGHSPDRPITCRGLVGCRRQYSLKHIGSSTINKQLGNTIEGMCAVECTEQCCPWEKAQAVVALSRTRTAANTIIVGGMEFAINKFWELIVLGDQWTTYIEMLLARLSVNSDNQNNNDIHANAVSYAQAFPYRTCDISLPTDDSGYVYFLVSVRDFDKDYVGQTENIANRLYQHNSGRGARGTKDPYYRPYCVAAYICGMSHMETVDREAIEQRWKYYNRQAISRGQRDIAARIEQGYRVVREYNEDQLEEENIRLIVTIERAVAQGNAAA